MNGTPTTITRPDGGKVPLSIVNNVEREDGSNHNWNVTGITPSGETAVVFCKTID